MFFLRAIDPLQLCYFSLKPGQPLVLGWSFDVVDQQDFEQDLGEKLRAE
jgi:hypothetical protein